MSRTSYSKPAVPTTWRVRLVVGLLALVLLPAFASAQSVADKYRMNRERNSQFNLAAGPTAVLRVNDYQCGLVNRGATCTDVFDSPTGGGGFWPTGSPNQYMFNSGLQIAGIIPMSEGCTSENKLTRTEPECFVWSGDTTGAFFFDASGVRQHGTALTNIYDSLNPDDLANWPAEGTFPDFPNASAYVRDTALFNDVLIGRQAASQQDSWVMYWDGDPAQTGGRTHPMGIVVEQRSLAWNYPVGNENVIYFIYKFTNVTGNPLFQQLNETRYAIELPDAGWRYDSIFVAFAADPDVTPDAGENYSTAILPFNMGISYKDNFQAPDFIYPPTLFFPPFFTEAPGIVSMQYLKSPINPATGEEVGLTSFSLTTNGGAFPDPATVQRGWRYLSLNVDAGKGDPNCTFSLAEVRERRSCYLAQTPADVRMFVGSGPFSLEPGASATIAVAQYAAATVSTSAADGTPTVVPGSDNQPGFPSPAPGCSGDELRPIEVASGWVSATCPAEGEELDMFDVNVVPSSLLGRAQVAQSIFSNKFLLGFAPETPQFFLVPGTNQITVVWEPSPTEQSGDPFFAAASDEDNPLFDPNYREFDVEGYRIYRGTSPADLDLVAQFDKDGSTFTDVLCMTDPTFVTADREEDPDSCTEVHEVDITGDFVQYTSVLRLDDGNPIVFAADTALAAEIAAGNAADLENTGIPFAYVDTDVRNGFQYFYRVTAFDINSIRSGPSSLESAGPAKSAVPAAAAPDQVLAGFEGWLSGASGEPLDQSAPVPGVHSQDGTFNGPMPPTNDLVATFAPLVERLLPEMSLQVRIDSVRPFYAVADCPAGRAVALNNCWEMHLTVTRDGVESQVVQNGFTPVWSAFGGPNQTDFTLASERIEADATSSQQFGIPAGFAGFNAAVVGSFRQSIEYSAHVGQAQGRSGSGISSLLVAGGSRWFSGENETVADPARLDRAGHIEGVDTIFSPSSPGGGLATGTNNACWGYGITFLARAADVEVRWSGGAAEVWDVTHDVPVIFKPSTQASYGFLTTDANGNGVLDYDDFIYIDGVNEASILCSRVAGAPVVQLAEAPVLMPVNTTRAAIGGMTPTGMGFGLYINGERYIFQMATLPTDDTWTLRTYTGFLRATSGHTTQDPSGYTFVSRDRPPMVPGLTVNFLVEQATILAGNPDLGRVHTVPDPYYVASTFDLSPTSKELQFVNLPTEATIRIYSLSGVLVDVVTHNDIAGGGRATWDLRNRSNQFVASGVYLYHVSTPDGDSAVGKFTVINSGIAR